MSDHKFITWLSQAEARITALHNKRNLTKERVLLVEAGKCESLLHNLFDHAERTKIDIEPHISKLTVLQIRLHEVRLELENRKQSIWRRVVNRVGNALGLIGDLLGLGALVKVFRGIKGFLVAATEDE